MAVLDTYNAGPTSTASGAFLNLQPAGATECVIHNVMWGPGNIEFQYWDGSNLIVVYSDTIGAGGSLTTQQFHCTNAKYYRIKSTSATILLAADGIYTK